MAADQRWVQRMAMLESCLLLALNSCDSGELPVRQGGGIARDVRASVALDRYWRGKADQTLVLEPSTRGGVICHRCAWAEDYATVRVAEDSASNVV